MSVIFLRVNTQGHQHHLSTNERMCSHLLVGNVEEKDEKSRGALPVTDSYKFTSAISGVSS